MAHFRGTISGKNDCKVCSRVGTKKSGLIVHGNGWKIGAAINLYHDDKTGKDVVMISITNGSRGTAREKYLGGFTLNNQGEIAKIS